MPLYPDILNDDCSDISTWTDGDASSGVSEVSPAGQFRLDTNGNTGPSVMSRISRTITTPPNTFTLEIKNYFDSIGTNGNHDCLTLEYENATWRLTVAFCSDGLIIYKTGAASGEVGTDIVKCNATAAWQTWRFQVTKTIESTATVTVYLKEEGGTFVSQGTVDCDYEGASSNGSLRITQYGRTTANRVSHIDYIKIATGLGEIYGDSNGFLAMFD